MNEENAEYWIEQLNLQKHPEGGYYANLYRSSEAFPGDKLPQRFGGSRPLFSSIYYLLPSGDISAFHRLQADEIWHYYRGSSMVIYTIAPDGTLQQRKLGPFPAEGEVLQALVPHNHWLAVEVDSPDHFSLAGCTLAPGFVFEDFELARREQLVLQFPQHQKLIERLTRE